MELLLGLIGATVLVAALILYHAFSWGFVLYKFWAWFLPVFPSLPHISFYQAVGLMLFASIFVHKVDTIKDECKRDKKEIIIAAMLAPWTTLGIGYFVYLFIH